MAHSVVILAQYIVPALLQLFLLHRGQSGVDKYNIDVGPLLDVKAKLIQDALAKVCRT